MKLTLVLLNKEGVTKRKYSIIESSEERAQTNEISGALSLFYFKVVQAANTDHIANIQRLAD